MTDKKINKWLRRRFSPLGWLLVGYYLLMTLLTTLAMGAQALDQLRFGPDNIDMDALMNNGWGYVVTILTALCILQAWKGPGYWREEVFLREKKMPLALLGKLLILSIGCQFLNSLWVAGLEGIAGVFGKSFLPLLESVSGDAPSFSMFLYGSLFAPVFEELLFRGVILRSLRPFGKKFAIFGSAYLFGIFHGNLMQTPYAFLMGLLLGYAAAEYSIWWAIGIHTFNNLVIADLLTRVTGLLPVMAAELVQLALLILGAGLSGVILARNRKGIAAAWKAEWMDRRVLKCFFFSSGVLVLTVLMGINILIMIP